jgi:hypothetical protein
MAQKGSSYWMSSDFGLHLEKIVAIYFCFSHLHSELALPIWNLDLLYSLLDQNCHVFQSKKSICWHGQV